MSVHGVAGPVSRGVAWIPSQTLVDLEYLDLTDYLSVRSSFYEAVVLTSALTIASPASFLSIGQADFTSALTIASSATYTLVVTYDLGSAVTVASTSEFRGVFWEDLQDTVSVNGAIAFLRPSGLTLIEGAETWVTHMDTGATTQFDDYGFNSFGFDGVDYWACADDGIYKITGVTDDGAPIPGMIQTGLTSFGDIRKKHYPNVWVGASSAALMSLTVESAQGTFTYDAASYDVDLQIQRFDLGRGLNTNYAQFKLAGVAPFATESISFLPVPGSRRIS